jgi:hypothetical protein
MFKARFFVLVGMIMAVAAARLIPHPPNFAPITAMALFGGAHFTKKYWAFLVPLGAMFLGDLVLGFHSLMPIVYGCFALIVCIGLSLRRRRKILPVTIATLASALLFFTVTNFGVWAFSSLYPKTIEGLATCYIAAIPFFKNTLFGDVFYVVVLFVGFALAERWIPVLREPAFSTTKMYSGLQAYRR